MSIRTAAAVVLVGAVVAAVAGCGSGVTAEGRRQPPTEAAASRQPSSPGAGRAYPARQVADAGLPATIGPGALSKAQVTHLMQYFEDKVARAYATGRSDSLAHYLAGPMLNGNRATIQLLAAKHRRNIFRIDVAAVHVQANEKRRVVFDMTGNMTSNYFVDATTGRVLEHGLPGPSQVKFLVFLDQNPATHTWYWTGEQSQSAAANATGDG